MDLEMSHAHRIDVLRVLCVSVCSVLKKTWEYAHIASMRADHRSCLTQRTQRHREHRASSRNCMAGGLA